MKFGMWTTLTLLLSCSFHAPALLLPFSSPAPASAQPLPYSCPASFKLLSGTFLAPPQILPCSALLCSALLLPCSCPAPALLMLQPNSCFAPALLLPCWSYPPQLGNLHHHHQHLMTFFGTARAAFYGMPMVASLACWALFVKYRK